MSDTLQKICADKENHVTARKISLPENELLAQLKNADAPRGFRRALQHTIDQGGNALIAEIKKASPSVGLIREDFDPATLAKAYAAGGASCLSVLTDEPYFQGDDTYLKQARAAVALPVLRKDFMIDPYQIIESRALGADCILLIMAALSDAQAKEMYDLAKELGMDVLVEVHDAEEMQRALTHLKPDMLGVNNRNLKTLKVTLDTSRALAANIPASALAICESGIHSHQDVLQMNQSGFHCFLVGESLMRQSDVTQAVRHLLGGAL